MNDSFQSVKKIEFLKAVFPYGPIFSHSSPKSDLFGQKEPKMV